MGLAILMFARQPVALFMLVFGSVGLLAWTYATFAYLNFAPALRHDGHLFILLLASCWIADSSGNRGPG